MLLGDARAVLFNDRDDADTFDMIELRRDCAKSHALGKRPSALAGGSRCSSASRSRSRSSRSTPGCPTRTSRRPRPISVILAGVLLKMGTYGILRINFADPAGGDPRVRLLAARRDRHHQHRVRRAVRDGADRSEEAGRLFLGEPHGLRAAGDGGADHGRDQRRGAADVQPRHHHRDALPPGRRDLRPRAPPRDRRLRRAGQPDADVCRVDRLCVLRRDGACRGSRPSSPRSWC